MKKKRLLSIAAVVFSTIMTFSGCSNETSKLLNKNDPVTITIWHYYNGVQQTMFDEMVNEFNETVGKEKGIIVEAFSKNSISELYKSINASINSDVGAEPLPNIFASYSEAAYLADKAGKLADIGQYFTKEELDEYVAGYIDEGLFAGDDSLKIFPIAKSTEIMMLNKTDWDIFAAACSVTIDELSTWEGLVSVAEKYYNYTDELTPDIANDGKAFFGRDSMSNYVIIGAKQLGHPFEATESDGTIYVNSDKATVKKLWENYYIPYIKGYYTANSRFRSDDAKTGDIIALICSTTGATYFPTEVTLNDDTSYPIEHMVLPVPNFDHTPSYIVQQGAGMCIKKSNRKTEYACTLFLKWFTDEERNIAYSACSGYLPVKISANDYTKISTSIDNVQISQIMQDTFVTAIKEINTSKLYTAPPFDNSDKVRDFLGEYIQTTSSSDREKIVNFIDAGGSYSDIISSYTDDAAFEKWYEGFLSGLKKACEK